MIKIKFNNTNQFIDVEFSRINNNVVQLLGNVPQATVGFTTWKLNGKRQLGDFSDYTTIYRTVEGGVQFSNNGEIWVEPVVEEIEPIIDNE